MNLLVAALLALAGAFFGAFAERVVNRRSERLRTTVDLYRTYHSAGMFEARRDAWRFLKVQIADDPKPFREFFSDADDPAGRVYDPLGQVIYFWQLVFTLEREQDLDPTLCRRLLGYQFRHWNSALVPLIEATRADESDVPDWLECFDEGGLDWLLQEPGSSRWRLPWRR